MMEHQYEPGDILAVDEPWSNETFYYLIEGELDSVHAYMELMYPYRCLSDGKTGWGKFNAPSTRKVA